MDTRPEREFQKGTKMLEEISAIIRQWEDGLITSQEAENKVIYTVIERLSHAATQED